MLKGGNITKGSIVVSSVNFLNWEEVNSLFSKMLHLDKDTDFFDYILKLNNADKYRYVFKGHPIPINYEMIKQAFELRHKIVHEIYDANLSNWRIICLWDNAMNIMDVGTSLFIPELQKELKSDYWDEKRKEGRAKTSSKSKNKII
jgi:hypothetical protein